MKRFESGERVFIGEFRNHKIDHVTWRDQSSGRTMTGDFLKHSVESGSDSLLVSERTPVDFDPSKYVCPFKKGQKVLVSLTSLTQSKGVFSASGKLEPIDG